MTIGTTPTLLYRATCRKCQMLSFLVQSISPIRRIPLDSKEAEALYEAHKNTRGKLALFVDGRLHTGWEIFSAFLRVTLYSRWLLILLVLGACGPSEPDLPSCPLNRILSNACVCQLERFAGASGDPFICDGERLRRKVSEPAIAPLPLERCNGLDDDLDGKVDEDGVCLALCTKEGLDALAGLLTLPKKDSYTVAMGSGVVPIFPQITTIPEFCRTPSPSPSPRERHVQCGEVLTLAGNLHEFQFLRVAPGGVVRFTEASVLQVANEFLLCPGGLVQAGGASSLDGPSKPGVSLELQVGVLIQLGDILSTGGQSYRLVPGQSVGDSGSVSIQADRWLLAGTLSTRGVSHLPAYGSGDVLSGGSGGEVRVKIEKESFLSGVISTTGGSGGTNLGCGSGGPGRINGKVSLDFPVCCHGLRVVGASGNGGDGGVEEDRYENVVRPSLEFGEHDLALCDREDRFFMKEGELVLVNFRPSIGVDIDLEVRDEEGVTIERSEGLGWEERVLLPPKSAWMLVRSVGSVPGPGAYHLSYKKSQE